MSDDLRVVDASVAQGDLDIAPSAEGGGNHVVVGDDVSSRVDNGAGANPRAALATDVDGDHGGRDRCGDRLPVHGVSGTGCGLLDDLRCGGGRSHIHHRVGDTCGDQAEGVGTPYAFVSGRGTP